MHPPDLKTLLDQVIAQVLQAGKRLSAEWPRAEGPRGHGDKAPVDVEIEQQRSATKDSRMCGERFFKGLVLEISIF